MNPATNGFRDDEQHGRSARDEPLQLFDFIRPEDPDADTEIKLNDATINQIVEECGDRPLCVVAIVGPSREGKSFVLNFMIRCLTVLERGEMDWIGWNDKTKPLEGFAFQAGLEPQTRGILIWSRPFFLKNADGKEVAILLVDTQGTNDEYTTLKDMSSIVGLSLLSSSITIFNNMNNLQEDVLQALNTFTEFGLLAKEKEQEAGHPFQSLCFLIRDWNNPDDFPYGGKGGKQLLKKKLELKPNQSKEAKAVRKALAQCFDEVNCFLMPSIGGKALSKDFTGSLEEISPFFAKKLEEFVNSLFLNELVTKKVLGKEVTALELKKYLEMYAEVFNSDTVPAADIMMEGVSKVHNDNVIREASSKYMDYLRGRLRRSGYLSSSVLGKEDVIAKRLATDRFKAMKKFGSPEQIEELEVTFNESLAGMLKAFKVENEERKKKLVSEFISKSISRFTEDLQNEFPLVDDEQLKMDFYEDAGVKSFAQKAEEKILCEFKELVEDEEDGNYLMLEASIRQVLQESLEKHLSKNREHEDAAHAFFTNLIDALLESYGLQVENFFNENRFNVGAAQVDGFLVEVKQGLLDSFRREGTGGNKEFRMLKEMELEKRFENALNERRKKWEGELAQSKEELRKKIDQAVNKYLSSMERSIGAHDQSRGVSEEELQKLHETLYGKSLTSFQLKLNDYPEGSGVREEAMTKLGKALGKAYQLVKHQVLEEMKKCEEALNAAQRDCLQLYVGKLKALTDNRESYFKDDGLLKVHQELKQEALKQFDDLAADSKSKSKELKRKVEEMVMKLGSEIEENFAVVKAVVNEWQQEAKKMTESLVKSCRDEYLKSMKTEINEVLRTEDEFQEAHTRTKLTVEEKLKNGCPIKDEGFISGYISALNESIEELFEELEESFELKKMQREAIVKEIIGDCRVFYCEEMDKHMKNQTFINPRQLERYHTSSFTTAVNRVQNKTGRALTPPQRQEVADVMKSVFEKFKEKNDMNLNMDLGRGIAPAIGIDLGTTYSCVAAFINGKVHIIPNTEQGNYPTTPSYVMFNEDGSETMGLYAKENAYKDPENTIYDAKRIIGRKMQDPELQDDRRFWPFAVKEDGGVPKIDVRGKLLYPEQVSAKLLKYFKEMAEKHLNLTPGTIKKAVITVPANFNDSQRQATMDAGELAGLEVLAIVNEPTAAAIAYSLERMDKTKRKVLVFDLGGGTFDVAILDVSDKKIDVIGVKGDTHLGGEDFDKNIMRYCVLQFQQQHGIDLLEGKDSFDKKKRDDCRKRLRRLQTYCEKAKKELASMRVTKIIVDGIINGKTLNVELTREKFNELNDSEMRRAIKLVEEALEETELQKEEIDDVVMIGGSSRILKVQELLRDFFKGKALNYSINPDEAVAYGAAVKAAMMNGSQAKNLINLTEISDVTPLSLGVYTLGDRFSVIIPKNTRVPTKRQEIYRTTCHNQTAVEVVIYQGEDPVATNNECLGKFMLRGIPPAPAGHEKIDKIMTIDANGILHVEAVCRSTKGSKKITVQSNRFNMSREAIRNILAGGTG